MRNNMVPICVDLFWTIYFIDLALDLIQCGFKDVCLHVVSVFHFLVIFLDYLALF